MAAAARLRGRTSDGAFAGCGQRRRQHLDGDDTPEFFILGAQDDPIPPCPTTSIISKSSSLPSEFGSVEGTQRRQRRGLLGRQENSATGVGFDQGVLQELPHLQMGGK